jgi:hypothetical protein
MRPDECVCPQANERHNLIDIPIRITGLEERPFRLASRLTVPQARPAPKFKH